MNKRFLLWAVLSTLLMVSLFLIRSKWFPPPQPTEVAKPLDKAKAIDGGVMLGQGLAAGMPGAWQIPTDLDFPQTFSSQHEKLAKFEREAETREAERRLAGKPEGPPIVLGGEAAGEGYKLRVEFSARGGAVRRIILPSHRAGDPDYAKPLSEPFTLVSDDDDGQLAKQPIKKQLERQSFRFLVEGADIAWTVKEQTPTKVVFVGDVPGHGVTVTRTFELSPGSYHLNMSLSLHFDRKSDAFAYRITGPRGLPVEGRAWQRMSYRQVIVGTVDAKDASSATRTLYPAQTIRDGKAETVRLGSDSQEMQYAGVMAQYFAALVVAAEDPTKARTIDSVAPEDYGPDTDFPPAAEKLQGKIGVTLVSRPMPAEPGASIEHKYLLYAGPVKVRLLNYEAGVAEGLPEWYEHSLHLNLMTDAPTYRLFGYLGWTGMVVFFTNLMHWLLQHLSAFAHNYGVAIILLTLIVRVCLFPISRRQALASQKQQQKMAAIKPELEKLKEKYKDDKQALGLAQMDLMKKHGVLMAPMKGCLPLLLQMPIMMGLYYALYESIDLRFAGFLWIDNLAMPDALWNWKDMPVVGQIADFLRLGPTFNLLPLISVTIMFIQQKWMMPPPADEQQAAQMKMMQWMPIFMAWMFYWVPAGLCVYFIVSGAWGLVERKLLPKISHEKVKPPAGAAPATASRGRARPSENGDRNGVFSKVAEWWQEVLKRAEKK